MKNNNGVTDRYIRLENGKYESLDGLVRIIRNKDGRWDICVLNDKYPPRKYDRYITDIPTLKDAKYRAERL